MKSVEERLREVVEAATPRLLALPEPEAARSPAAGRWSPKQVLGHLVDSASNNHQRFVRAQSPTISSSRATGRRVGRGAALPGCAVERAGRALAALQPPPRARDRGHAGSGPAAAAPPPQSPRAGLAAGAESEETTLEYFLRDYVGHLEHHLAQVLARPRRGEAAGDRGASFPDLPAPGPHPCLRPGRNGSRMQNPRRADREGVEPARGRAGRHPAAGAAARARALRPGRVLAAVAASRALHRPWVQPPTTPEQFRALLRRMRQPSHRGFVVRLRASDELVASSRSRTSCAALSRAASSATTSSPASSGSA